ncbi:MAG: hypothetical protein ABEI86_13865, partial [Halobacteriaceae archaeon]
SLAGCAGQGSSNNNEDSPTQTPSGGVQTTNKTTKNLTTIKTAFAPLGITNLIVSMAEDEGILQEKMKNAGYKLDIKRTWSEKPLFASGKIDLSLTLGAVEGARIGPKTNEKMTVNGYVLPQFGASQVKKGGPFDPENTGSKQATIDKIVNENAKYAIGSWSGGHVPPDRMIIKDQFDYQFTPDGDFNVVTASYTAIPKLLVDGKIAIGGVSPPLGGAPYIRKDQVTPIFGTPSGLKKLGLSPFSLALGNCLARKSFTDKHAPAVKALLEAWQESAAMFHNNPKEWATKNEEYTKMIGATSAEQAEFIAQWCKQYTLFGIDLTMVPKDPLLTDDYIQNDKRAMKTMRKFGVVPENWNNFLSYNKL